jgi:hypothetical protein
MPHDVRLDLDGLLADLDLIATVVEMIVAMARDGVGVPDDLDSLEADVLLGLTRVRRRLDGLQPHPSADRRPA